VGREGKGVSREEEEKQKECQKECQVSTTKPLPTHRLAQEGVSVTPQHPPPPSAALLQPKTEP
jgi:hypothetical protein